MAQTDSWYKAYPLWDGGLLILPRSSQALPHDSRITRLIVGHEARSEPRAKEARLEVPAAGGAVGRGRRIDPVGRHEVTVQRTCVSVCRVSLSGAGSRVGRYCMSMWRTEQGRQENTLAVAAEPITLILICAFVGYCTRGSRHAAHPRTVYLRAHPSSVIPPLIQ